MDFESPGKQSDDSPGPNNGGTMWTIWRLSFYWSLPGGIHKSCKLGEGGGWRGGGSATEVIKNKMNTNLKLHPLLALLNFEKKSKWDGLHLKKEHFNNFLKWSSDMSSLPQFVSYELFVCPLLYITIRECTGKSKDCSIKSLIFLFCFLYISIS